MRYFSFLIFLAFFLIQCKEKPNYQINHTNQVKEHLINNLQNLSSALQEFTDLINANGSADDLQNQFLKCRLLFKNTEWATEYYLPTSSKSLNGPALDQLDLDENKFIEAQGFQVLEEYLFPKVLLNEKAEMIKQIKIIDNLVLTAITNIHANTLTNEQIFDGLRLGVFKITALGITGFDTPASDLLFPESKAALKGIQDVLDVYQPSYKNLKPFHTLSLLLTQAQQKLSTNAQKNTFDYLTFITTYLDPISVSLHQLQRDAQIPFVDRISMLKPNAPSLFAKDVFDLDAVAFDEKFKSSDEKIKLGEKLFYDTKLSKDNQRSCASCHHPEKAFTDGLKVATDLVGSPLFRNTPSLNYAGFYHGYFWDMRQADIESLTVSVIENKDEMHGDMASVLAEVQNNSAYLENFKKVYKTNQIENWQVQNALATYVRSLSTFSSPFDDFMRGDKTALTNEEQNGFNVFVGKGKCATCHFIPLFNGTVPPRFTASEQEVLGVPSDSKTTKLDTDLGRQIYNMDLPQLKNSFKTVTIRNVEKTAPYMHNGVFTTLDEVVDFYNKGGGLGFGLHVENQTLPADSLDLTDEEQKALIAFMKALNDK